MNGYHANIEKLTVENEDYRRVLYTTPKSQLVLMKLAPGEEIGMEVHEEHDQFFSFRQGEGKAILDGEEVAFSAGDTLIIPAGTEHNVINTSASESLKLFTIYTPPEHKDGTVHHTKADDSGHDHAE